MAASTLPQLPVELISDILFYLVEDGADTYFRELYGVYGLRLTCRALYEKTLFNFTKVAFSTLHVDFSLRSLDRLHAISQHARLQNAVKCIYFGHDASHPIYLGKIERAADTSLAEMVHYILEKGLRGICSGLPNLSKIVITTPFVAPFRSICETDQLHGPSIFHTSTENDDKLSTSRLQGEIYTVKLGLFFQLLLDAANRAGSRIDSLEVQATPLETLGRGEHKGSFAICVHSLLQQRHNWPRHIRELRLSVEPEEGYCGCIAPTLSYAAHGIQTENALYLTLQNTPQLTMLRISFTHRWPNDSPGRARLIENLASLHLPHLTTFGLLFAPTEEGPLTKFLSAHQDQLQKLLFYRVNLIRDSHWQSVLTWLLNHHTHRLNELLVDSVQNDGQTVCTLFRNKRNYRIYLESPGVGEGLRQALSVMNHG
jgi:hypothetical protein